jgi:N-glycosidase YbiA
MPEMSWEKVPFDPIREVKVDLVVRFYESNRAYGVFSNFSRHPITMDGRLWPTSEHAFQAQKFARNFTHEERIRAAKTPFLAAQMGRDRSLPIRRDWTDVRDDVMRNVLEAKFSQHEDIRSVLLSTFGAAIIEHTANDHYWGDAGDGSGQNKLGKLLMKVRDRFAGPTQPKFLVPPWTRWPTVENGDLFYRMGIGEGYLMEWWKWRKSLSRLALTHYDQYFPPPATRVGRWY